MAETEIVVLEGFSDPRGEAVPIPAEVLSFLGGIAEVHVATMNHGAVRGNHIHDDRKEVLVVVFSDGCELAWQGRDDSEVREQAVHGRGALAMLLDPGVAHAIRNPGRNPLFLAALSDQLPVSGQQDTRRHVLLS